VGKFSGCLCSLYTQQNSEVLVFTEGDAPGAEFQGRNDPLQEARPILGLQHPGVSLAYKQARKFDSPGAFAISSLEGFGYLTARVGDSV